jgi:hypothetical protein
MTDAAIGLVPVKRKTIYLLTVSTMFVAIGLTALREGSAGWLCTIFFALGAVVFAVQLFPRESYLRIKDAGFEFLRTIPERALCFCGGTSAVFEWRIFRLPGIGWWSSTGSLSPNAASDASIELWPAADGLPDTYG